jgi:hypothetical protein
VRWNGLRFALGALLIGAVLAPGAGASPASDFAAILKDYSRHQDITSCLFTQAQLESARAQLSPDIKTYSPGLATEISREIKRWKDGDCKGKRPGGVDVRIVKITSKGPAKRESVTLRNEAKKTVSLRSFVLSDASDHAIRFKKTTIKPGRSLIVVTGCRKGSKAAVRKGNRYYACRSTEFWDDAGDTVELVNAQGGLLSQKSYGTPPAPA